MCLPREGEIDESTKMEPGGPLTPGKPGKPLMPFNPKSPSGPGFPVNEERREGSRTAQDEWLQGWLRWAVLIVTCAHTGPQAFVLPAVCPQKPSRDMSNPFQRSVHAPHKDHLASDVFL